MGNGVGSDTEQGCCNRKKEKAEDLDYKNIVNKRNNHVIRLFRLFLLPAYDYDCDYDCDNNYGEYNTNCANNHIC